MNSARKGDLPIQLPSLVAVGDRITAKWANSVRDTLQRLKDRRVIDPRGNEVYEPEIFLPLVRDSEDPDFLYQVHVFEGYVIETMVADQTDGIQVIFHEVDGVYEGDNLMWHGIEEDQAVYVKYEVSIDGTITGQPEIIVDEKDIEQTHYHPSIGEYAGTTGTHYVKIGELEIDQNLDRPKIKQFHVGDHITHIAERGKMTNVEDEPAVGEAAPITYNVLKNYIPEDDTVDYRTIQQLGEYGVPIIATTGVDSIPFKTIRDLESEGRQINVTDEGNGVLIRGNGVDGTLTLQDCDNNQIVFIRWVDGLITTPGDMVFVAGCSSSELPSDLP